MRFQFFLLSHCFVFVQILSSFATKLAVLSASGKGGGLLKTLIKQNPCQRPGPVLLVIIALCMFNDYSFKKKKSNMSRNWWTWRMKCWKQDGLSVSGVWSWSVIPKRVKEYRLYWYTAIRLWRKSCIDFLALPGNNDLRYYLISLRLSSLYIKGDYSFFDLQDSSEMFSSYTDGVQRSTCEKFLLLEEMQFVVKCWKGQNHEHLKTTTPWGNKGKILCGGSFFNPESCGLSEESVSTYLYFSACDKPLASGYLPKWRGLSGCLCREFCPSGPWLN